MSAFVDEKWSFSWIVNELWNLYKEHKKKLSLSKNGNKNHNYGKKMSDAQRKKISESNKGRIPSEETRQKLILGQQKRRQRENRIKSRKK
jgi:hypothetical protein